MRAAALHAPSCVPGGDALECFTVAGIPAVLTLKARDVYGNACAAGGREWGSTLEVLMPDASDWRIAEPNPTVHDDPHAPAGSYLVKLTPPHTGPLRLTLRPLVHGVPSTDMLTIGLLASPSPSDPSAFHLSGEALRVAVAGEPAQLVLRPRSFGDARALASRTFGGLKAWLALPGGGPDGTARLVELRVSRRRAHPDAVVAGIPSPHGRRYPSGMREGAAASYGGGGNEMMSGSSGPRGSGPRGSGPRGSGPRGADGPSEAWGEEDEGQGLAAETTPFPLPTEVSGGVVCGASGSISAANDGASFTSAASGGAMGKAKVARWQGSDGSWSLLCTQDDLYDVEEWPLHFTSFHATRSAAVHVELFGVPIGGAPYACTVLPAATNAAKSVVRGLERFVRAGDALSFSLRTRDRFGNDRWSGGDGVRIMLLRASTPGGIGKVFTKADQRWGGIVRAGLWTAASSMPADGDVSITDGSEAGGAEAAAAAEATQAMYASLLAKEAAATALASADAGGVSAWGTRESRQSVGAADAAADLVQAGSAFFASAEQSIELLEMRGASSVG